MDGDQQKCVIMETLKNLIIKLNQFLLQKPMFHPEDGIGDVLCIVHIINKNKNKIRLD